MNTIKNQENNPLVSIVVITYNSGKYIFEGLKSIESQTYENIEVIISDDCSTDNTVEICKEWINNNKNKFKRVELIEAIKNTGVAGNLNRGIKASNGEWIKTLSGDDKLLPNTIQGYVDFINSHPEANICFAMFEFFGKDKEYVSKISKKYEALYADIRKDLESQRQLILRKMFIPGPGIMYKKTLWEKVGGFDEKYQFAEEYPFFDKVILGGERIFFIPKKLYLYQIDKNSLGRTSGKGVIRHLRDRLRYIQDVKIDILSQHNIKSIAYKEIYNLKSQIALLEEKKIVYLYYALIHHVISLTHNWFMSSGTKSFRRSG